MLRVGQKAPKFALPDETGAIRRLNDAKVKRLLLYFYPKDFTPGCTLEACALRDAWEDLRAVGVMVFGVSADSVASHARFAQKHRLPFPLLADPDKVVIRAYGAWGEKKFLGRTFQGIRRTSFLIDLRGKIARIYPAVRPAAHAAEVLRDAGGLARVPVCAGEQQRTKRSHRARP